MKIESQSAEQIQATLTQNPETALPFAVTRADGTCVKGTSILVCDNASFLRQTYPDVTKAPHCSAYTLAGLVACLSATDASKAATVILNGVPGLLVEVSLRPDLPADSELLHARLKEASIMLHHRPVELFTADSAYGLHLEVGLWGFIRADDVTQALADETARILGEVLNRDGRDAARWRMPESITEHDAATICESHGEMAEAFHTINALGEDFIGALTVVAEDGRNPRVDLPLAKLASILRQFEQQDLELFLQLNHYSHACTALLNGVPGMLVEVSKRSLASDDDDSGAPVTFSALMIDLAQASQALEAEPVLVLSADLYAGLNHAPGIWAFIPAGYVTRALVARTANTLHQVLNGMTLEQAQAEDKAAAVKMPVVKRSYSKCPEFVYRPNFWAF